MPKVANIPDIAELNAKSYAIIRDCQTQEERDQEDLNDKKAAWLSVVREKGLDNLTERDRNFAIQYIKENIHYSLFYYYKDWLPQFIENQRTKYGLEKK